MITLVVTTDPIKLNAVRALLAGEGIDTQVFDAASGALLQAAIPLRLMIAEADGDGARRALRQAGFVEASDGDWDLK